MRILKIIAAALGALLVVLVIGATLLLWWVDPNDYRDDIERLVEQRTGRQLRIGGELDLKLFPRLALRIQDVSLGNPPGFGDQPFLAVKSASVGVRLLPLLSQRLEVSRVAVDGLAVTLVSRGEDVNNWQDLGQSDEAAPSGEPGTQASIAGLDVSNARLVYRDEAEDSITRLSGLELHTGPLGTDEPVPVRAEFDFDQGEPSPLAHLTVDAQVHLPKDASRAQLADLAVRGEWLGEKPIPVAIDTPSVILDLEEESLAPTTFEIKLGELPLRLTASGTRLFSALVVDGEISVPQVSPRKVLPSLGVEMPATRDAAALTKLAFSSGYRLTESRLRLNALNLLLDETKVEGAAGIEDFDKMALVFDLDVNAIDVDRYMEPEAPEAPAASTEPAAKEPTELPIEALRELNAKGRLRIGRARFTGLDFSNVHLPLEANAGLVHLGPTRAKLFGGSYDGDVVLDARPAEARLSLNEHVRGIDLGALMKAAFETTRVTGRGDANAVLTARGNTDEAMFRSLAGKIDTDVKNGAISGLDLWYELRRAWAVVKRQPLPVRAEGAPRTEFRTLTGSATLADGVLTNRDLRIDLDYLKASGNGTLDLASKAINYQLTAEIYKLPPADGGAEMSELKAAEIPINITGTVADIKVRPDVEGLVKARVRKEVTEKVEETKEELKKKLEDRLKGFLGG